MEPFFSNTHKGRGISFSGTFFKFPCMKPPLHHVMASPIFLSKPPPGFTFRAIFRGIQLSIVGIYRSLLDPKFWENKYYSLALRAILVSVIIQVSLYIPVILLELVFSLLSLFTSSDVVSLLLDHLKFIQSHIFNLHFLLITSVKFFREELDGLFFESLKFADATYKSNHPSETYQGYYESLVSVRPMPNNHGNRLRKLIGKLPLIGQAQNSSIQKFSLYLSKYLKRTSFTLFLYLVAHIPQIGPVIVSTFSFIKFNKIVGTPAALCVFSMGLLAPSHYLIIFLSTFHSARTLVSELLQPYFRRVMPYFSKVEKRQWLKVREGILFGFGISFYYLISIPYVGILMFGLAEASAAYLLTKISDPLPDSSKESSTNLNRFAGWVSTQTVWNVESVF